MGMVLQAALLLGSLLLCSAFLDLSGPSEIKGVWKGSVTLPCAYVPVEDLVQQTLTWSVAHHQSSGTIFRRDSSGDHVLLSEYRDRVSVLKDTPGNVSLLILNLEISDRGTYICQVTWRASNNSMIAKEIVTKLEVVKVAATKPTIRAGQRGLTVPAGASTSLTCEASGSPPISYRWFRGSPGGKALLLSSSAELAWDSLRPSDSGTYFCEAANRAGAGAAQQSDAVELTVTGTGTGTDLPTTTAASWRDVGTPGRRHPTTGQGERGDIDLTVTGTELMGLQSFSGRSPEARGTTPQSACGAAVDGKAPTQGLPSWEFTIGEGVKVSCENLAESQQDKKAKGFPGCAVVRHEAARDPWGEGQGGGNTYCPRLVGRTHRMTDLLPTMLVSRMDTASEGPVTDTGAAPAELMVGPAAALAGAALGALGAAALGWRRRRRRKDEPLYEVAFHSTAGVTALESEVEAPVKCLHKETCSNAEISNDILTKKDRKSPEYENLVTAMESEY